LPEPDRLPPPLVMARFVRLKLATAATPFTLAATVYEPLCPLAVNAGAVAIPLLLVIVVAVAEPLNKALAPVPLAVNVTVTPLNGLLFASFTVACRALPNAVLTVALCGVPAVAVIFAGKALVLVRVKLAPVLIPAAFAETV
jgi:hypothetical protein